MAGFVLAGEWKEAMLKINVDSIGDLAVVECEGRLVEDDTALRLRDAVTAQKEVQIVVLRLSKVHAIGGKSLIMLVSLRRWARDQPPDPKI
jgi:hypothetical protein